MFTIFIGTFQPNIEDNFNTLSGYGIQCQWSVNIESESGNQDTSFTSDTCQPPALECITLGEITITIVLSNQLGTISQTETVKCVLELTADTVDINIEYNDRVVTWENNHTVDAPIEANPLLIKANPSLWLGLAGSRKKRQAGLVTQLVDNSTLEVNFLTLGQHSLGLTVSNGLDTINIHIGFMVLESASLSEFYVSNGVAVVSKPVHFDVIIDQVGSFSSFAFSANNITTYNGTCSNDTCISPMNVSHTYDTEGTHYATFTLWNSVSSDGIHIPVTVVRRVCEPPLVEILGTGHNASSPKTSYRNEAVNMVSSINIQCQSRVTLTYELVITTNYQTPDETTVQLNTNQKEYNFPSLYFPVGQHSLTFLVQQHESGNDDPSEIITVEDRIFLNIFPSPLVVALIGGEGRALAQNVNVTFNADGETYDPDVSQETGNDNVIFKWCCTQTSANCFERDGELNENETIGNYNTIVQLGNYCNLIFVYIFDFNFVC